MGAVLRLAGVYNILWGAAVVLFPLATLRVLGMDVGAISEPGNITAPLWQCIGMIVGVYGIGYWIAANDVYRHWPIVLVGLLGKILGPIGFVDAVFIKQLFPVTFGWTILTNDLIWWAPFALILLGAYRAHERRRALAFEDESLDVAEALAQTSTADGRSLAMMSSERPLLLVFLRHAGCTFCREALADLRAQRESIERAGLTPVLVHMTPDREEAERFLARYELGNIAHVPDPDRRLYNAMRLRRGTLGQLFGLRVWLRGVHAGLIDRHLVGALRGDGFQMPGAFVVANGRVIRAYRHRDASDRPDYGAMSCDLPGATSGHAPA